MAFDESGQATTLERRIEICTRAYRTLTQELGYPPHNIIFDPNVLTIGTGMEEHRTFAIDFIETIRYIKQHLPGALVSGGVSNLSFAFRGNNTIREAMHSVFLYHAIQAGLDMAIVNPAAMIPYGEIPEPLKQAVEDVVLNSDADATARLTELASSMVALHGQSSVVQKELWREEAVATRLTQAVVQGETQWLHEDIEEALAAGYRPIAIIEEVLMEGMTRVGKLFGEGKMFLPQVIKSARVMKQAVMILQPILHEKGAPGCGMYQHKGIIATVKGDVHDIGKNIAAVVLECNHYQLIDLGVMVPAEEIVRAVVEHQAGFVGLSGLITPSLEEMCTVAEAMEAAGIQIPLLIGGATTSKEYAALRMASKYSGLLLHCPDASAGVGYLSRWFSQEQREALQKEVKEEYAQIRNTSASCDHELYTVEEARQHKLKLTFDPEHLALPAWLSIRDLDIPTTELRNLINWNALYTLWEVHGGAKKEAILQQQEQLRLDAGAMLDRFMTGEWGQIRAVVGFFPAHSDEKEGIKLYADEHRKEVIYRLELPRQLHRQQPGQANLCLSDFVAPASSAKDHIGLFAINASPLAVEQQINIWRAQRDDYRSLLLRSLCDRLAEAASVWLHQKVQTEWWGHGAGTGIRPAFGYPSCPNHAPKADVLRLLNAQRLVGLTLTDTFMLQPVSALCGLYFAHPQARYFSV
jgi:5-methyltetrahydrofolate--homocysteine methyltransferase